VKKNESAKRKVTMMTMMGKSQWELTLSEFSLFISIKLFLI